MSMLFVTPDGGLTALGYFASTSAGIVLFLAGGLIPKSQKKRLSARQLAFCGAAMALAFVTSYIRLFSLPYGGSVTLFSTLFIIGTAPRQALRRVWPTAFFSFCRSRSF